MVDSVAIEAEVDAVGVERDGQMELPPDPDRLGWYRFGPAPQDLAGSVVLGGHLDSLDLGIGQLARLRQVAVGDSVVVVTSAGATFRYIVTMVRSVPRAEVELDALFRRSGEPELALVTCGGAYDEDLGGYQENLIVTAEPA